MTKTAGHIIRLTGLVIEMFGVWATYSSTGPDDLTRIKLPGGNMVPVAWIAVGLGFVLWLTGTVLVFSARRPRSRQELKKVDEPAERLL